MAHLSHLQLPCSTQKMTDRLLSTLRVGLPGPGLSYKETGMCAMNTQPFGKNSLFLTNWLKFLKIIRLIFLLKGLMNHVPPELQHCRPWKNFG